MGLLSYIKTVECIKKAKIIVDKFYLDNIHLFNKYLRMLYYVKSHVFQNLFTMTSETLSLTSGSSSFKRETVVNQTITCSII